MDKTHKETRAMAKQEPDKKPKKTSERWFTLTMSALACILALLVGLHLSNKSLNYKAIPEAEVKSQESVQVFHSTEESYIEPNFKEKPEETTSKSKPVAEEKKTIRDTFADFKILPRLDGIKVGHVQNMELEPGKFYKVETKSLKPPIFEIPEFLTLSECQQLIEQANNKGLTESMRIKHDKSTMNIELTNKKTFTEWDYNKDGMISVLEVMHNLIDLEALFFSERDIYKMFIDLNIDQNENGFMDQDEFFYVTTDRIMNYLYEMALDLPRVLSRNSRQTWVDSTLVKGLNDRVVALTQLPLAVIEGSGLIQVVNYGPEGHYHCHHDSYDIQDGVPCCHHRDERVCRLCRYITVLFFLNDVEEGGETAFPIADNATFSDRAWDNLSKYRCDLSKHCHNANLYVKPQKGKAIMWYNHFRDNITGWLGQADPQAYHGGCDVIRGRKWIANSWIKIIGESRDKMVSYIDPNKRIY